MLRPVPIPPLLPFSIAVFGITTPASLFLIGTGASIPIVTTKRTAVRDNHCSAPRARMLGGREGTVLFKVVLPSALPSIFTASGSASASPGTA